jgi:hypothetical protein
MEALLKAYEKSGIPFDDIALRETTTEVSDFCQTQQHLAVGSITEVMAHAFPGGASQTQLYDAVSNRVVHGVSHIISALSRDLSIRRDEVLLEERKMVKAYGAGLGKKWDIFVCHASEDKEDFVRPLSAALRESGLSVWYDEFSLTVGDSLRSKIDEGLSNSRYGIVVLSKHFFAKKWPQRELDGLVAREVAGTGPKVILPVWHGITYQEISENSPTLAGRLAARSDDGMDTVVRQLREAMGL